MGMVISVLNIISTFIFKFVAFMIKSLYNLIVMLADVNFFSNDSFKAMKSNIFGLIGLFMVFKLAFSIIQYITDPDKMSDKSAGAGKILTKVVVVLILLGTINTIFDKAFELQGLILKNAVLERLIFGETSKADSDSDNIDPEVGSLGIKTSDYLAYSILAPFVRFNTEADIWGEDAGNLDDCDEFIKATDISLKENVCHSKCTEVISKEDKDAYKSMCKGLDERNMYKALIDVAMLKIDKTAVLVVDGLFGLIVGALCIVVLTVIAVGVAIRSVKLSFLNLIAPLPIISYIDPKENSNSMFNKWSKETIKTFLELFIRLIAFYFAILIITKVLTNGGGVQSYSGVSYTFKKHPLVIIFLIIGCFLFALQLPKLIENLFGSMGGFSRDAKSTGALAAGIAGITGGIVGGAVSNAVGTAKAIKDENGGHLGAAGLGRSLLAFGTGAVGTGFRSAAGAVKGFKASGEGLAGAKWSDISSKAIARTGAIRNARALSYTTAGGKVKSAYPFLPSIRNAYGKFADMAGIKDDYSAVGRKKIDIKAMENALRTEQTELSRASSDRMAALQQYNEAVRQREMVSNSAPQFDEHMFDEMGGQFDSTLDDFTFDVGGGVRKSLHELTAAEYRTIYTNARSSIATSDQASFDSRFRMDNTTNFAIYKNRVQDDIRAVTEHRNKLAAATTAEAHWKTEFGKKDAEFMSHQTKVNDLNKNIAKANKQVETINKAVKKS